MEKVRVSSEDDGRLGPVPNSVLIAVQLGDRRMSDATKAVVVALLLTASYVSPAFAYDIFPYLAVTGGGHTRAYATVFDKSSNKMWKCEAVQTTDRVPSTYSGTCRAVTNKPSTLNPNTQIKQYNSSTSTISGLIEIF